MIHLQQIATPVHDIVAGLCFAVARNFVSTLGRGKQLNFPVSFQGGVAANAGMVRAFRELIKCRRRRPDHTGTLCFHGSHRCCHLHERSGSYWISKDWINLTEYLEEKKSRGNFQDPLIEADTHYDKDGPPPAGRGGENGCFPGTRHWFPEYQCGID